MPDKKLEVACRGYTEATHELQVTLSGDAAWNLMDTLSRHLRAVGTEGEITIALPVSITVGDCEACPLIPPSSAGVGDADSCQKE